MFAACRLKAVRASISRQVVLKRTDICNGSATSVSAVTLDNDKQIMIILRHLTKIFLW